jgi:hypothetical protein
MDLRGGEDDANDIYSFRPRDGLSIRGRVPSPGGDSPKGSGRGPQGEAMMAPNEALEAPN